MAERTAQEAKAEKLAAALRENLKRRKAQARGRAGQSVADLGSASGTEPGEPPKPGAD